MRGALKVSRGDAEARGNRETQRASMLHAPNLCASASRAKRARESVLTDSVELGRIQPKRVKRKGAKDTPREG
jgi:hypothetical protein